MEFAEILKKRNIQHICTSVYHPVANGAIERFHCVLKSCIQSAIVSGKPWNPIVTQFIQVYRATSHAATGQSPFELFCGRKMHTCLNILRLFTGRSVVSQKVSLSQKKIKAYTETGRLCAYTESSSCSKRTSKILKTFANHSSDWFMYIPVVRWKKVACVLTISYLGTYRMFY